MMKFKKYLIILVIFIFPIYVKGYAFEGAGSKTIMTISDSSSNNCSSTSSHLKCTLKEAKPTYYCGNTSYDTNPGHCGCSNGYKLIIGHCFEIGPPVVDHGSPIKPTVKYQKTYTVSYDGQACGQSASITADGKSSSFYFWNRPSSTSINVYYSGSVANGFYSDSMCDYYIADKGYVSGNTMYLHLNTQVSRCCSAKSPPKTNFPSKCYRKPDPSSNDYIYKWTNVIIDSSVAGWEVVNSIKNENDCNPPAPTACTATATVINKKDNNAKYCNQKNLEVSLNSGFGCSNSGTAFYNITCNDSVKTDYSPVDFSLVKDGSYNDERVVILKAGQGFGFEIKMNHTRECNGVFSKDKFDDAYNKANNLLSRAIRSNTELNSRSTQKEVAWYTNIRQGIVDIAKNYINQYTNLDSKNEYSFNYNGTLSFNYKYKGKNKTYNGAFKISDKSTLSINKNKYTATFKLVDGTTVHNFNYAISEKAILEPKEVYFDKYSGLETSSIDSSKVVSGGNKFYTNLRTDPTDDNYDINIKIDVYNGNKVVSSIKNNICDIKIKEDNINYRIITVSNPFVNSTRKIGDNWLNDTADYTKVIKSDTWSRKPLYTFNISREDILNIKNSNINDSNAYLGTCYKTVATQDYGIRDICNIINSK